MRLTPRQASTLLGVEEATLQRWIEARQLPVHHVQERVYVNPVELWEWAVEHGIAVPQALLYRFKGNAKGNPEKAGPGAAGTQRGR